ncbi:hypothetical protein LPJ64_006241 [Coemansia asiatica]|uniref:Uncharacterized protein n=1 Tax=Coemansia asiatica TaxID=1052880 RepID=A0A9W8CFM1_9FUNG|nr:hypothetical protein LPJ64_006241 [Coemansia asiatica]
MDTKDNDSTDTAAGFDECDRLAELHGASAVKSPTILSPALTDGDNNSNSSSSSSSQKTDAEKQQTQDERKEAESADTAEAPKETHSLANEQHAEATIDQEQQEKKTWKEPDPEEITLKQLYGMLCWLKVGDNRSRWVEKPLDACMEATVECPHLINADPRKLTAKLDALNMARLQIIKQYGGAQNVPQDVRMFEGGPLFVLFHHAVSAPQTAESPSDALTRSQIMANATGLKRVVSGQPPEPQAIGGQAARMGNKSSSSSSDFAGSFRSVLDNPAFGGPGAGGPMRHQRRTGTMMPNEHPFMQRARRLTPEEIRQMRDELAIRREIGIRDAVLLADWIALRRRELELKEAQIRDIVRGAKTGTVENMVRFEEFMRKMYEEM